MNVPKGNAVALQALKPIENKTADILSGYVFELIKQKKADDVAKAKQIADSNKTWFDAYKDLKIDPTVTAKMYQDTSNKLFLDTKDLISKAGMLSQDPNLSEQEKMKMYNVAQNAQTQYNMFRSTLQNEKALAEYYKGNEDIANGTAFQLSDDIAFRAMIDSHSFETKLDENGNIIIRGAKSPLSNEYKDYTLGEAVALMSKRPEKDLLNGKGGFLDQLFNDAEKMKQSWSSDTTGFKTTSWTKFSEENGGKYFDTVFGEYSPNYIDPRLKQYARQILQKDIESKEDFAELKKSVINYMSTAVPTSSKVDVAKPTVVNVNNGSGGGSSKYEILTGGNVVRKMGGGTVEVKNAVVVDLKDKGQIMGIKVPNKDKKGFHIEYAILGKDKFGRSAYERITQKSDAEARLKSQKLDPNLFESLVMKQNAAQYTAIKEEDDIGTINYYKASKQVTEGEFD